MVPAYCKTTHVPKHVILKTCAVMLQLSSQHPVLALSRTVQWSIHIYESSIACQAFCTNDCCDSTASPQKFHSLKNALSKIFLQLLPYYNVVPQAAIPSFSQHSCGLLPQIHCQRFSGAIVLKQGVHLITSNV